jgi:hypothetical protein
VGHMSVDTCDIRDRAIRASCMGWRGERGGIGRVEEGGVGAVKLVRAPGSDREWMGDHPPVGVGVGWGSIVGWGSRAGLMQVVQDDSPDAAQEY